MTVIAFGITYLRVKAAAIYNVRGSHQECEVQLWIGPFRNIAEKNAWREAYCAALTPLYIRCTAVAEQVISPKVATRVAAHICPTCGPITASLTTRSRLSEECYKAVSSL